MKQPAYYYYSHPESDDVWRTKKQLTGTDFDQGVMEIDKEDYNRLRKELGLTRKETTQP